MKDAVAAELNAAVTNAIALANNSDIISSLRNSDRELARKTILPVIEQYKKETDFKSIKVHLHTKDVKSFLRS